MRYQLVLVLTVLASAQWTAAQQEPKHDGRTAGEWIERLSSSSLDDQWAAIKALGELGASSPEAIPALVSALGRRHLSSTATNALTQVGSTAIPYLVEALEDDQPLIRAGAANSIGQMGSTASGATAALAGRIRDEDTLVRCYVVTAFGQIGSGDGHSMGALETALQDEDRNVRSRAMTSLWQLGGASAEVLVRALEGGEPDVRRMAAGNLGGTRGREDIVVPALQRAIEAQDPSLRANAARSLAALGPDGVGALMDAFRKGDDGLRLAAADALRGVETEDETLLPLLDQTLGDPDPELRCHALWMLGCLGDRAVGLIPRIADLLEDDDAVVRWSSASTIGPMGEKGRPAEAALVRALRDRSPDVREAAARALEQVGPVQPDTAKVLADIIASNEGGLREEAMRCLRRTDVEARRGVGPSLP